MNKAKPQSTKALLLLLAAVPLAVACTSNQQQTNTQTDSLQADSSQQSSLPEPDTNASKNKFSKVIGWPEGKTPVAPAGFTVTKYASNFKSPRNIYVAPNGDILVVLSNSERSTKEKIANAISGKAKAEVAGESANSVVLLRDKDRDGKPELQTNFLSGLNQPYGVLIIGNNFYVANTDGLYQYPYKAGDTKITAPGKKILELPAGGYNNHWTRNLIANADNSKIYVSVGSGSNVGENGMEHEVRRANILEINPDGSGEIIYASGLRNPVGMSWAPGTSTLWTAVNERDGLGDDLVPDYITSVKKGGFYGWPYAYYGQHEDPRMKGLKPDLVASTLVPDVAVGAHTASLGLAFYTGSKFPEKYENGAFIGQHGSWNRSVISGYQVAFVPFKDGKPAGKPEGFLTGFIANEEKAEVYGRPVGVAVAPDGALLVADDVSNTVWRVAASK
ncbi:L-sorbosone dehydrogenase [Pedobacter sp. BAL39]|uniref:PQQ-dependent sugar dehydrogenase n=1 Tax=Pedobacter sp. BAL39 TaxID=391596 RepID=UPI0001559BD3|nr:sorbosone dehydrogenase family protein [Pedobacter sp. BAL39]EDM36720.1 L-sorbosone dehydrogenase [Pedobacter sp. BAL39]